MNFSLDIVFTGQNHEFAQLYEAVLRSEDAGDNIVQSWAILCRFLTGRHGAVYDVTSLKLQFWEEPDDEIDVLKYQSSSWIINGGNDTLKTLLRSRRGQYSVGWSNIVSIFDVMSRGRFSR